MDGTEIVIIMPAVNRNIVNGRSATIPSPCNRGEKEITIAIFIPPVNARYNLDLNGS